MYSFVGWTNASYHQTMAYNKGDIVINSNDDKIYICKINMGNSTRVFDSEDWLEFIYSNENSYEKSHSYSFGDVMKVGNNIYMLV